MNPPAFDDLPLAAALLDGTRAGFGPIDDCLLAKSSGAFSAPHGSVDREPLTPPCQRLD
jgi:hypothetical protein